MRRLLLFCGVLFCAGAGLRAQTKDEPPPLVMDPFTVDGLADEEYDQTGMGSVEEQIRDEPFSNDLISLADYTDETNLTLELAADLAAVSNPSPSDRIVSEDRLNLRGFPTPTLRNSFIRVGVAESLNSGRTIVIQGPLVPVLGRAAPGGIQDVHAARPRVKAQQRLDLQFTDQDRRRVAYETTGPVVKKKAWQRVAVNWQRREGPEAFTREELLSVSTSLTWKHSRAASSMISADYRDIKARVTPGIPEYRPAGGGLIAGPYLPLAYFNANGPEAAVRRRSMTIAAQFDGQINPNFSLRANVEGWWRDIEQDRFTTSVLSLDTGLFEGTREPRHIEQPHQAIVSMVELTGRFRAFKAVHKFLATASHTWGTYGREDRALSIADRNALPLSVRRFDPFNPDYYAPAYDPLLYNRVVTDRTERARYGAIEISDRMAFARGRWVASTGLRYDTVELEVQDDRVNAPWPLVRDTVAQLSYHAGLNWQVAPSKLLAYASVSTAFDPSTRVDARTGRIQDNETTLGYEAGVKGRSFKGKVDYSAGGFQLFNQHISRRNPLYDDPIADANQTQPQLVAAGEERYRGLRFDLRWQIAKPVLFIARSVYMKAVTTASPDLPQEIGREISRLPGFTATAQLRYRSLAKTGGWFSSGTWQYIDGYVGNYADTRRAYLEYPGYGVVHGNVGYSWRGPKRTLEVETGVRNLFDRDLLTSHARVNADRELTFTTRLYF